MPSIATAADIQPKLILKKLPGTVSQAVFSLDGRLLFTNGWNRDDYSREFHNLRVWDSATWQTVWSLDGYHSASRGTFSVSGQRLAVYGWSHDRSGPATYREEDRHWLRADIRILDTESWTEIAVINRDVEYSGPLAPVIRSIRFSPDGRFLACGQGREVILWNTDTWQMSRAFNVSDEYELKAYVVAFSPDGSLLAVGDNNGTIWLWGQPSFGLLRAIDAHNWAVISLGFSPDGSLLASGSDDWSIGLWSMPDGARVKKLRHHKGTVEDLGFTPDSRRLFSGGRRTIAVWDVSNLKLESFFNAHSKDVASLSLAADGTTLASAGGDRSVKIWDISLVRPDDVLGTPKQ